MNLLAIALLTIGQANEPLVIRIEITINLQAPSSIPAWQKNTNWRKVGEGWPKPKQAYRKPKRQEYEDAGHNEETLRYLRKIYPPQTREESYYESIIP